MSTPCVGLCSTTFGDLVCRGCKRYVHEIVGWNGFSDDERAMVIERLLALRDAAVTLHVRVADSAELHRAAAHARVADHETEYGKIYELLRRTRGDRLLADFGVVAADSTNGPAVAALRQVVDREFLLRSQAHYEYSFRVKLQDL